MVTAYLQDDLFLTRTEDLTGAMYICDLRCSLYRLRHVSVGIIIILIQS